ncbi:DUF2807 domain-containing protein [Mucilaginibacter sp. CAU 1740]|uniref:GIN domain-containing protein n=1 Tax=Mucilaginibacter sp. CAU 1740 TaxID=3140365 RepID=UPI00325B6418
MKTSTKLIIIFFMCIPTSLLAYNFILKAEYKKGNVVRDLYPKNNSFYVNKTGLPKFTHVVINGSLNVGNGGFEQWMAHVWVGGIDSSLKADNRVGALEELKDNLEATVKNDTLFISFHATGKYDRFSTTWNHESDIVKIYASKVKSVSIRFANVTIGKNPDLTDSLNLTVGDYSRFNVQNLQLQKLTVVAKDSSSVSILQSNKIGTLNYSIQGKSILHVDGSPAQRYVARRVDSAAMINLTGKASILQKQLH